MSRRPIVAVDCDGVLADLLPTLLTVMSAMLGRDVDAQEVTHFDWINTLLPTAQDRLAFWAEVGARGVARNLPVYPGAKEGLAALSEVADVHIVTSPVRSSMFWMREREDWLAEHFGIKPTRVTHTASKHLFASDMIVDDRPDTIVNWAYTRDGTPVLWAREYNQRDSMPNNVVITDDWGAVEFMARHLRI